MSSSCTSHGPSAVCQRYTAPYNLQAQSMISRELDSTEQVWHRAYLTGTGIVVLGFSFDRKFELDDIQRATAAVQQYHPITASQIRKHPKGNLIYVLKGNHSDQVPLVTKSFPSSFENGVKLANAAHSTLHQTVEFELSIPLALGDNEDGPFEVFEVNVYTVGCDCTLVILRFHGGAVDRKSVAVIGQTFLSSLNAIVAGTFDTSWEQFTDGGSLFPAMSTMLPPMRRKNFLQKGFDAFGYVASSKKSSLLPFQAGQEDHRTNKFLTQVVSGCLGVDATVALEAVCGRKGTTIFGAECAALLRAVAVAKQLTQDCAEEMSVTSIVDCRAHLHPPLAEDAVGLFTAGLPLSAKVSQSTPFWELAKMVSEKAAQDVATQRQFTEIPVLNMLFSQAIQRPGLTPKGSLRTSLLSAFTTAPQKAMWQNVENLDLVGSFGPFASMHGVGPCIAIGDALKDGPVLHISLVYAAPLFSREMIKGLVDHTMEELHRAVYPQGS